MSAIGANLQRFKIAVNAHDRNHPEHDPAYGIGLSPFDLDRLGFEDGEELWPGIRIHAINCTAGNFQTLCGSPDHDGEPAAETIYENEIVKAVAA